MTSAQVTRDAALRRLRQANRWIAAAAVVGTGALTEVVAKAFAGHTITKRAAGAATPDRSGTSATGATHRHRHRRRTGLTPAPVAPAPVTPAPVSPTTSPSSVPAPVPVAPAPSPAPVVSGGS
jgi:hypothetical protein